MLRCGVLMEEGLVDTWRWGGEGLHEADECTGRPEHDFLYSNPTMTTPVMKTISLFSS